MVKFYMSGKSIKTSLEESPIPVWYKGKKASIKMGKPFYYLMKLAIRTMSSRHMAMYSFNRNHSRLFLSSLLEKVILMEKTGFL